MFLFQHRDVVINICKCHLCSITSWNARWTRRAILSRNALHKKEVKKLAIQVRHHLMFAFDILCKNTYTSHVQEGLGFLEILMVLVGPAIDKNILNLENWNDKTTKQQWQAACLVSFPVGTVKIRVNLSFKLSWENSPNLQTSQPQHFSDWWLKALFYISVIFKQQYAFHSTETASEPYTGIMKECRVSVFAQPCFTTWNLLYTPLHSRGGC